MKSLRKALLHWLATPDERKRLNATPEQRRLLKAIQSISLLRPEPEISKQDAEAWESALRTPVGLKVDVAMYNWLATQAQNALTAPSAELVAHAKFALGCRAGWEMGKSISRLAAAHSGELDEAANTATASLAHLEP